jgi:hypothetical protein
MRAFCYSIVVILVGTSTAFASQFCDGFEEGYKTVKGELVLLPICPLEPITPIGSTPFREGLKAGMDAAR